MTPARRRQAPARPTFTTAAEARAWEAAQWTESTFQAHVMALARRLGWRVYHTHDSRKSAAGFPDLVLVHGVHGVLWRELKREKGGRVSPEQETWLEALRNAGDGEDAGLWYPHDWVDGTIAAELRGQKRATR